MKGSFVMLNKLWILVLVLLLGTSGFALAVPLANDDVVIIIKTGVNSDGTYKYEVADSNDSRAAHFWDISMNERAMTDVLDYYSDVQKTTDSGLSTSEQELLNFYGEDKDPVYIEIVEGSKGAYCDWKADFTLQTPDGNIERCKTPKVVFNRNDPLLTGNDRSLQTQTLVHEIAHGAMSKLYGYNRLPYTEWLHKAHSGGTVSDEKLAIIEGWAEFAGAYFTGDHTIANDPDNSMSDNRYAYKDIYSRTQIRTASELKKTEGWVASTLLKLTESNTVSMDDLTAALEKGTPHTFDSLIEEVIKIRPEKEDAIKTAIGEASMGQIYGDHYTTIADYTPTDSSYTPSYSPEGVTFPDFSNLDSVSGSNPNKAFYAVITGALLGAIAGAPFGIVGIAVGGIAGLIVGNFIGEGMRSEGYVSSPITSKTGIPQIAGDTGEPDSSAHKTLTGNESLTDLRNDVDNAFNLYLNSVQHGTIDEQKSTLGNYRTMHRQYRQMLMKEETGNQ